LRLAVVTGLLHFENMLTTTFSRQSVLHLENIAAFSDTDTLLSFPSANFAPKEIRTGHKRATSLHDKQNIHYFTGGNPMATINPYLNFAGNTEEAFTFYKSVFGGEFMTLQRFKDVPGIDVAGEDREKIMHVSLPIGNGNVLMATDALESMGQTLNAGNNFSISINAASKEEATSLFTALSEGGKVVMPLEDAFWGAYFGMFTDKFGIQWMVNFDYK
jgi:PhnB protein